MELEMETKTSTATPELSITEDEHSPLIEVNSSEIPSKAEPMPILEAAVLDSGNNHDSMLQGFCNVFCGILLYAVVLSIIYLSVSLLVKTPDISPTFHVDSVTVSSLNLSDCQISSNWNISFNVKNPKHGHPMFYDAIRILILYDNEYYLSMGNVESFYQGGGQESEVEAWFKGSSVNVEKWVVRAIETDMNTRREMDIGLVLDGLVTTNPGLDLTYRRRQSLKVSCKDLKLQLFAEYTSAAASFSSRNSRIKCHLNFEDEV